MGAPVIHFEIMGGEGNQLEEFYSELFGWKINSNNPMKYGVVDTGGGPRPRRRAARFCLCPS
jgi:uncharacterized protein